MIRKFGWVLASVISLAGIGAASAADMAVKARPVVVPAFIIGLTNSVWAELRANLRGERPVRAVFGEPIDLGAYPPEARLVHHKKCADLFNEKIAALGAEEKALRA